MDKYLAGERLAVETPRLRLVACDVELVEAMLEDRAGLERLLGADLHPEWPGDDTLGFLPYQAMKLHGHAEDFMWGIWLMLLKVHPRPMVIGDLGYKGPPDDDGAVDLGYGIVPEMRLKGYTFEAAKALVAWAFSHPEVRSVTADCYEDNTGSIRVLEKLGMTRMRKDGRLIRWAMRRPCRENRKGG